MNEKGIFIVFEGIDGSGKTTQCRLLRDALQRNGFEVALTREPTDGKWGRKIREIASSGRKGTPAEDEMTYFIKDREEHVREVIMPALEAGKIVVCDRYYYSTIAYQGALGLDPVQIRRLNEEENDFPRPDLVVYVDVEPEQSLKRISENRAGGTNEGYEKKEFLEKVKRIFDAMPDENIERVSGADDVRTITESIATTIKARLDIDLSRSGAEGENDS